MAIKQGAILLTAFLRVHLCIFASLLAINGFLIFNPVSLNAIKIFPAAFLTCAAIYSYNNITDKKEDLINRKTINPFSASPAGTWVVFLSAAVALMASYRISPLTLLSCALALMLGTGYSRFRIKKHSLVKNLCTALIVSLVYLMGSLAGQVAFSIISVAYFVSIYLFILAGSIVSDIRDYKGDLKTGIRTLPVLLGLRTSELLVCGIVAAMGAFVVALGLGNLYILAAASGLASAIMVFGKLHAAHTIGGVALIVLTVQLLVIG